MKILFTSVGRPRTDTANGVELEVYRVAETLASLGHDVLLACITNKDAWPIPGVDVRAFRPAVPSFRVPPAMKKAILEWKPDAAVIWSAYTPFNNSIAAWCRGNGLPYVARPCGGYGRLNERVHAWRKRPFKALFELPMLDRALFVWAGGDAEDIRLYGTSAPVVATPRGLDIPVVTPGPRSEVKALKGVEDRFVFGFVGRLDPIHKGLDLAIDAFQRLGRNDAALILVGPVDPKTEQRFQGFMSGEHGTDGIRLAGPLFRDDRDRFLGSIDAFVHTSRWEGGVPNSVIEAAAMARPLLITRQADPDDLLYNSGGCVRVDLDPDSIAQGMRKLMEMPDEERAAMGSRAARAVESAFGWDKVAQGLIQGLQDHGVR